MADEGGSLARKKRPGSKLKQSGSARRLLQADLEERPAATLRQTCEFLYRVAAEKVRESTVSRMLKRMGWSPSKVGRCERYEFLRVAWRVMVAGEARSHAERLVFVDEMGANISLASLYAWSRR
jgi:transposase